MGRFLGGDNIAPKTAAEARLLIGKRVTYLRECDVDKSGRGYFFPRHGTVTDVKGRAMDVNDNQSYDIHLNSLLEMEVS